MTNNKKTLSRDHQTVVIEEINSNVKLILEQFSGVNRKIDGNHQEFLEFKDEMLDFKGGFVKFRKETDENFHKLFGFKKEADANFKVTLEYLQRIDDEIQSLKSELVNIKPQLKDKTALDKVLDMEKRLLKIEKLVFAKLS